MATLNPDGGPQASVVWILRDGDTVLFSAIATRREDPPPEPDEVARVIVRVVPERVNSFSP